MPARVSRFGEFSPNGRYFALGKLMKITSLDYALILTKIWVGQHFGRFFSQTHLVTLVPAHQLTIGCRKAKTKSPAPGLPDGIFSNQESRFG
jgi:hypothetical protein